MGTKGKRQLYGDEARRLYVELGHNITDIHRALKSAVSDKSLRKWRDYEEWDKQRNEYRSSSAACATKLKRAIIRLTDRLDNATIEEAVGLADAIAKLDRALDRVEPERTPLLDTIEVLDRLTRWLESTGRSEALQILSPEIGEYTRHLADSVAR